MISVPSLSRDKSIACSCRDCGHTNDVRLHGSKRHITQQLTSTGRILRGFVIRIAEQRPMQRKNPLLHLPINVMGICRNGFSSVLPLIPLVFLLSCFACRMIRFVRVTDFPEYGPLVPVRKGFACLFRFIIFLVVLLSEVQMISFSCSSTQNVPYFPEGTQLQRDEWPKTEKLSNEVRVLMHSSRPTNCTCSVPSFSYEAACLDRSEKSPLFMCATKPSACNSYSRLQQPDYKNEVSQPYATDIRHGRYDDTTLQLSEYLFTDVGSTRLRIVDTTGEEGKTSPSAQLISFKSLCRCWYHRDVAIVTCFNTSSINRMLLASPNVFTTDILLQFIPEERPDFLSEIHLDPQHVIYPDVPIYENVNRSLTALNSATKKDRDWNRGGFQVKENPNCHPTCRTCVSKQEDSCLTCQNQLNYPITVNSILVDGNSGGHGLYSVLVPVRNDGRGFCVPVCATAHGRSLCKEGDSSCTLLESGNVLEASVKLNDGAGHCHSSCESCRADCCRGRPDNCLSCYNGTGSFRQLHRDGTGRCVKTHQWDGRRWKNPISTVLTASTMRMDLLPFPPMFGSGGSAHGNGIRELFSSVIQSLLAVKNKPRDMHTNTSTQLKTDTRRQKAGTFYSRRSICESLPQNRSEFDARGWTQLMFIHADNNLEESALVDLEEMLQPWRGEVVQFHARAAANLGIGGMTVGGASLGGHDGHLALEEMYLVVVIDRSKDATAADMGPIHACENLDYTKVGTGVKKSRGSQVILDTQMAFELLRIHLEDGRREWLLLRTLGEVDMNDPSVLSDSLRRTMDTFPAEHYAVTLWNHGSAWIGFGDDESNANNQPMSLTDIAKGLKEGIQSSKIGQVDNAFKLSMLGFDACLMASYDVIEAFAPFTHFVVASEDNEPGHGWNYRSMDPTTLARNPPPPYRISTAYEYGSKFIATYGLQQATSSPLTLSLIETRTFLNFKKKWEGLLDHLFACGGSNVSLLIRRVLAQTFTIRGCRMVGLCSCYDLADFLSNLLETVSEASQAESNVHGNHLIKGDSLLTKRILDLKRMARHMIVMEVGSSESGRYSGMGFYFPDPNMAVACRTTSTPSGWSRRYHNTVRNKHSEFAKAVTDNRRGSVCYPPRTGSTQHSTRSPVNTFGSFLRPPPFQVLCGRIQEYKSPLKPRVLEFSAVLPATVSHGLLFRGFLKRDRSEKNDNNYEPEVIVCSTILAAMSDVPPMDDTDPNGGRRDVHLLNNDDRVDFTVVQGWWDKNMWTLRQTVKERTATIRSGVGQIRRGESASVLNFWKNRKEDIEVVSLLVAMHDVPSKRLNSAQGRHLTFPFVFYRKHSSRCLDDASASSNSSTDTSKINELHSPSKWVSNRILSESVEHLEKQTSQKKVFTPDERATDARNQVPSDKVIISSITFQLENRVLGQVRSEPRTLQQTSMRTSVPTVPDLQKYTTDNGELQCGARAFLLGSVDEEVGGITDLSLYVIENGVATEWPRSRGGFLRAVKQTVSKKKSVGAVLSRSGEGPEFGRRFESVDDQRLYSISTTVPKKASLDKSDYGLIRSDHDASKSRKNSIVDTAANDESEENGLPEREVIDTFLLQEELDENFFVWGEDDDAGKLILEPMSVDEYTAAAKKHKNIKPERYAFLTDDYTGENREVLVPGRPVMGLLAQDGFGANAAVIHSLPPLTDRTSSLSNFFASLFGTHDAKVELVCDPAWLGDKVCDAICDIPEMQFDLGDCPHKNEAAERVLDELQPRGVCAKNVCGENAYCEEYDPTGENTIANELESGGSSSRERTTLLKAQSTKLEEGSEAVATLLGGPGGQYICQCKRGYRGDGIKCIDIDECEQYKGRACHKLALCFNTRGSYRCVCQAGYVGDGRNICVPIAETSTEAQCLDALGNSRCPPTLHCLPGDICGCSEGFYRSGDICNDIDECAQGLSTCASSSVATCVNTEGAYLCSCNDSFEGDGRQCVSSPAVVDALLMIAKDYDQTVAREGGIDSFKKRLENSLFEAIVPLNHQRLTVLNITPGSILVHLRIHASETSPNPSENSRQPSAAELLLEIQRAVEDPTSKLRNGDFADYAAFATIERYTFMTTAQAYGEFDILALLTDWLPKWIKERIPREFIVGIEFILVILLLATAFMCCTRTSQRCRKRRAKTRKSFRWWRCTRPTQDEAYPERRTGKRCNTASALNQANASINIPTDRYHTVSKSRSHSSNIIETNPGQNLNGTTDQWPQSGARNHSLEVSQMKSHNSHPEDRDLCRAVTESLTIK